MSPKFFFLLPFFLLIPTVHAQDYSLDVSILGDILDIEILQDRTFSIFTPGDTRCYLEEKGSLEESSYTCKIKYPVTFANKSWEDMIRIPLSSDVIEEIKNATAVTVEQRVRTEAMGNIYSLVSIFVALGVMAGLGWYFNYKRPIIFVGK